MLLLHAGDTNSQLSNQHILLAKTKLYHVERKEAGEEENVKKMYLEYLLS